MSPYHRSLCCSSNSVQPNILPELTTGTVIGISVAIAGNILISLALNLQKLAHKRLEAEKNSTSSDGTNGSYKPSSVDSERRAVSTVDEDEEGRDHSDVELVGHPVELSNSRRSEGEPLLPFPRAQSPGEYGALDSHTRSSKKKLVSRIFPFRSRPKPRPVVLPVDIVPQSRIQNISKPTNVEENTTLNNDIKPGNESDYLKSKLWWSGFLLMNVGEMGNFISYAWAPASVVAPLGTFALVANCLFSPLIQGERFRKRDIFGIVIAIIGAITVVLSSNASNGRLNPEALVRAISQTPFIVYACIYAVGAMILASLSQSSYGQRYALVDIGLCALFGGFTVLSTKAVSTLLTMPWSSVFNSVITYPVILCLVLTGVGQIRYLNRALMRFDSKIVIPIQFVLFNLSAIIGSAILYGDFRKASFHQIVTFLYGCAATFAGVFIIAWSSQSNDNEFGSPGIEQPNDDNLDRAASVRAEQVASNLSLGSLGRRKRATLVLPDGISDLQSLHHKHSAISVMGLSPAQVGVSLIIDMTSPSHDHLAKPLLLVHTPPREHPIRDLERDGSTPSSYQRQRAVSWLGDDSSPRGRMHEGGRRTRESSLAARLRSSAGTSGVSQAPSHPPNR
ncbi:magnesium transporter NIPA-domain-containing protein [Lentinula aciculospora]|uniref:Magnesium transporter NIPA-domain-containing protein n=1 Tax=Lentinula aciculospora TaxID=153920 RepID=A0A9W9A1J9_9AGAR|nr:magnesium transporter NIPA-domain-containing protein [Lentinula aciculospora]